MKLTGSFLSLRVAIIVLATSADGGVMRRLRHKVSLMKGVVQFFFACNLNTHLTSSLQESNDEHNIGRTDNRYETQYNKAPYCNAADKAADGKGGADSEA